jgi:cytochrome c oxidase cbb3-type subunit III
MTPSKHISRGGLDPRVPVMLCCMILVGVGVPLESRQQKSPPARPNPCQQDAQATAEGRQLFASRCAGCHALDGRGGERAPDIATSAKTLQRSDEELSAIIEKGLPGTGMPAFASMGSSNIKSVVTYVRQLQGKKEAAALPGNAEKGHALFDGKARCANCHTVAGAGGFIAGDLTAFGANRSVEQIRDAIVKPSNGGRATGRVMVTTRDGRKYSGVLRNEDNFSLQMQALDGSFHLFVKQELQEFTRLPEPLMPSDYGTTLGNAELNDVISFLISAARTGKAGSDTQKKFDDEGDE